MSDERPRKVRHGARVLVRCRGRILLMADRDPGIPGSGWWVTPGGGIDEDEDARAAAARELFEETGHRCEPSALVGPVAHRVVTHGYSDRILVQDELFFALDVDEPFAVDTAGFTPGEQQRMGGWGWFGAAELVAMTVWPAEAGALTAGDRTGCLELGEVEESTVPVGHTDGARHLG